MSIKEEQCPQEISKSSSLYCKLTRIINLVSYLWAKSLKKFRGKAIKASFVNRTAKVEAGSHIINTFMDRYSFCGYDCEIYNCRIGSFTSIGNNVVIGGGRHPMEWVSMSPVFYNGRDSIKKKFSKYDRSQYKITNIGNDVWIGERVMIKEGISIGDGSVVGMGSIVTKDVAPYAIVAGNPATLVRWRFDELTIKHFLEIQWWKFSDELLEEYSKNIQTPEIFIKRILK
jgi:acetyltransferase-like isoleucine patch superfamily enzyme